MESWHVISGMEHGDVSNVSNVISNQCPTTPSLLVSIPTFIIISTAPTVLITDNSLIYPKIDTIIFDI